MKKAVIGLSFFINVVVIGVVIWAVNGGLNALVTDFLMMPNYNRHVTLHKEFSSQSGGIVFLGDSITRGAEWNELFLNHITRNRGINGDTTQGVLNRLDPIVDNSPRKLFLLIGTNDLYYQVSEQQIVENVLKIIRRVNEASPETEIYVQSVLPRAADYKEQVESLNQSLEQSVAGKANWVNLYPLFIDDEGESINDALSNDELHLLGEGYIVWRDAIAPIVGS